MKYREITDNLTGNKSKSAMFYKVYIINFLKPN